MNASEQACYDMLVKQGYTVLRRGWPDFLVVTPDILTRRVLELDADLRALKAAIEESSVLLEAPNGDDMTPEERAFAEMRRAVESLPSLMPGPPSP